MALRYGTCGENSFGIIKKPKIPVFCGKIEVNNFSINLVFGTYYGFLATCGPNSKFIGL
jgi:hypothetical protein